jgi:ABC-type glutathione transport system ATPase component
MINIRELEFSYRSQGTDTAPFAMRIDKFVVLQGTSTALVGPSRSGKTTMIGLIAGTLQANARQIEDSVAL